VAYCFTTNAQEGSPQKFVTLVVRDIAAQTNLVQLNLDLAIQCSVGRHAFDPLSNSSVLIGTFNYFPNDRTMIDTAAPLWQLREVDIATGQVIYEANATMSAVQSLLAYPNDPFLPVVRYNLGDIVIFLQMPISIGGMVEAAAIDWRPASNTFSSIENYGLPVLDFYGGELVWASNNPNFPAAEVMMMQPYNILTVASKAGGQNTIFYSPTEAIIGAQYIDEGLNLAINLAMPTETGLVTRWVSLNRDGSITNMNISPFATLEDAAFGHVTYTITYGDPNTFANPSAVLIWSNRGVQNTLLQLNSNEWRLVWSKPSAPSPSGLAPFPAVTPTP
jgi:hypothetical protein